MDPDEVAAGCFEFRLRTRSFDLHQLAHGSKLKKFGRLFRASSDAGMKQTSSVPSSSAGGSSPHHSPPRRRRFVRVVRDKPEDCAEDGRYVVHKYSEAFLARMNRERFAIHVSLLHILQKFLLIKHQFIGLALLAKDVLCTPVSKIVPYQNFYKYGYCIKKLLQPNV